MQKLKVLKRVQSVDYDSPYIDTLLIYGQGVSNDEVEAQLEIIRELQSDLRSYRLESDDFLLEDKDELSEIKGIEIIDNKPVATVKGLTGLSLTEICCESVTFEVDDINLF